MGSKPTDISQIYERNQEATIYVGMLKNNLGNLDPQVDEEILWELFTQVGIVKNVHIPRDKVTNQHQGYGFVEFDNETEADYAQKVMNSLKVYHKPIRCNKAAQDKRTYEIGANLFIGNLDPDVDEKLLYDTFSAFGLVLSTKIVREDETGLGKGFGFVSFDSFDSSDAALASMNGQYLCNRPIQVSYAYKKDTTGERHGTAAERLLAANRPNDIIPTMEPPPQIPIPPPPIWNSHAY